jgi:hypothetical protein
LEVELIFAPSPSQPLWPVVAMKNSKLKVQREKKKNHKAACAMVLLLRVNPRPSGGSQN